MPLSAEEIREIEKRKEINEIEKTTAIYDDEDEKIKGILKEVGISDDPDQNSVIEYFEKYKLPKLDYSTVFIQPYVEDWRTSKERHETDNKDYTSELEKKYKMINKGGEYYIFCLDLSEQNKFNAAITEWYKKTLKQQPELLRFKELYRKKIDCIARMLNSSVIKKNMSEKKYKQRTMQLYSTIDNLNSFSMFPISHDLWSKGIDPIIIYKYAKNLEKTDPEKFDEWKKNFQAFKSKHSWENAYFQGGGGWDKDIICKPAKYTRYNGDPFYELYRHPLYSEYVNIDGKLVGKTYKTPEEQEECDKKKTSIHALIVIKVCINDNIDFNNFDGDLNTAEPTGESIVSMLVQYERIIVNGKFYSETYMDKKTVETLCDDEPVEQKEFDIRNKNKYLPDSTEDMRQNDDDEEINEEDFENTNKQPSFYDLGTADTTYENPQYETSFKSREKETFANDFDDYDNYEEENFGGGRKRRTKKRKHFSKKCHKTSKKKCKKTHFSKKCRKTLLRKGKKTMKNTFPWNKFKSVAKP